MQVTDDRNGTLQHMLHPFPGELQIYMENPKKRVQKSRSYGLETQQRKAGNQVALVASTGHTYDRHLAKSVHQKTICLQTQIVDVRYRCFQHLCMNRTHIQPVYSAGNVECTGVSNFNLSSI